MLGKIGFLLLLYIPILVHDFPKLKSRPSKERLAYTFVMVIAVYLSVDFTMELHWPNLNTFIDYVLMPPSKWIMKYLKPAS